MQVFANKCLKGTLRIEKNIEQGNMVMKKIKNRYVNV